MTGPAVMEKRRGRPPKAPGREPELLTHENGSRLLRAILGDTQMDAVLQKGLIEQYMERYQPMLDGALEWEAQDPCPSCHARPGYNPITGIWVRSWDQATRSWIEGHRASCITLARKP